MNEIQISNIFSTGQKISTGIKLLTLEEAKKNYSHLTFPRSYFNNTLGIVKNCTDGAYLWIPVTLDDMTLIVK